MKSSIYAAAGLAALSLAFQTINSAQAITFSPQSGSYGSAVEGSAGGDCSTGGGSAYFDPSAFTNCVFSTSQNNGATGGTSDFGNSISATASPGTGILSANATAVTGGAFASAIIWNTLTFAGAAPGAMARVTMSGISTGNSDAVLVLSLFNGVPGTIFSIGSILSGGSGYSPGDGSINLVGLRDPLTGAYTVTEDFPIFDNRPMEFVVGVNASASINQFGPSYPASSITDPYSLDLPDGVTFTSAAPLDASVPEPITLSLFGTGLAGAIAMRRRKKKAA